MTLAAPWRTLRHYLDHPLGRRDRLGTLARIIRWQVGSRVLGRAVAVPIVDGVRLLVRTGMHGATGNVYVGLMEFEDMAFVLHLLEPDDCFIDVGANVGIYSLLAASRGARVLALEPVPNTYQQLLDNLHLNRYHERVDARNLSAGSGRGELHCSTGFGPMDHVLAPGEQAECAVVAVEALDVIAAGFDPVMIKIDVEGFETEVVHGAGELLGNESLQAVLIELNELGARYGFHDAEIHARLREFGFTPASYEPFARRLTTLDRHRTAGNTLYVRDPSGLAMRLADAKVVIWGGISF